MPESTLGDRYRLGEELGRGGIGTIYRARDDRLNRDVAVKLLEGKGLGTEGKSRLLEEARLAAQLNHPNIVTVYDAGEANGSAFIVMELVEGSTLHEQPPETIDEALRYATQLCDALDHAHSHGVIHRDIKPENVIIAPDGTVKLMDFGLAQSIASRMTSEGLIVGTVFYLAPEQAFGSVIDQRTDLYALGVLMYEMVTGQLPFTADEPLAVISQHLHAPVVPPSSLQPGLPSSIEDLILRLLEKDPAGRPGSAAEVAGVIRAHLDAGPKLSDSIALEARLEHLARGRLVGRKEHLRQLVDLWRGAVAGRAPLALISGEPGVGKTRLANEVIVLAALQGATILRGGSYEFEASTPYMPFVEAVRQWVHDCKTEDLERILEGTAAGIAKLAPEIEARMGDLDPLPPLSPNEERLRLFDHLARFLDALAEPNGLLVFLDDLHWADQGSIQMLHYLLRHLDDEKVLFLGCYRELELDRAHPLAEALVVWNRERLSTRIGLDRFGIEETRELLSTLFQEPISDEFAQAVHRETEGNPFFVEEVVKSLIAAGDVYREEGRWQRVKLGDLALPQSIKEAIGRRLDRLGEFCLDVLHTASAMGKTFPYRELSQLHQGEDDLLDALDQASQAQLIEPAGLDSFVFTHDKIREVLYQELNPVRRRRLHQRIGEALESVAAERTNGYVQDMAHHFVQSGDLDRGLKYALQAAEDAREVFALEASLKLLEAAEECAKSLGDEGGLVEVLALKADNLGLQGYALEAIEACQQAIDLADDSARQIGLLVDLGLYYIMTSDERARDTLTGALERMDETTDQNLRSHALTLLGREYHYRAEHTLAIEFFEQACALADPDRDPMPLIFGLAFLAGARQHMLQMDLSNAAARETLALGERYDNPVALAFGHEFLAENAGILGEWELSLHHAAEDERIGKEMGSLDRIAWSGFSRANGLYGQGKVAQAARQAVSTFELAEEIGEVRLGILTGYVLAIFLADRGEFDLAGRYGISAIRQADQTGQPALRSWTRVGMARAHLQKDELHPALNLLDEADAIRAPTDNQWVTGLIWPLRAEVNYRLGRMDAMASDLAELSKLLEQKPGVNSIKPSLLRLRAVHLREQGDMGRADQLFEEAQRLANSLGSRAEVARTLGERAVLLDRMGQQQQASLAREQALHLMSECGLNPEAERVRANLDRQ